MGFGPSSNTWPRWASQFAHTTSVRTMPRLVSLALLDGAGRHGLEERRPAAAGVELRVGDEEVLPAAHALVGAGRPAVVVLAREGALGAVLARHLELLGVSCCFHSS